jgi:hypothetical protein
VTTWTVQTRFALGVAPIPIPAAAILLLGVAIGPAGLNLLSAPVLTSVDPGISAALAALGILIGLDVDLLRRYGEGRLLAAATLESAITLGVVALVFRRFAPQADWLSMGPWLVPVMLGVSASSSGTAASDLTADTRDAAAARVGDLNDVLPIVAGGAVLAWAAEQSPAGAGWLLLNGTGIAMAVAVGGWLLVSGTGSEGEQRVYSIGVLLLLAGAAAYLWSSALFAGFVAGALWNVLNGMGRDRIARAISYLQHPLIVMLLIFGGARLNVSTDILQWAGWFVLCRIGGKLVGGWVASRTIHRALPGNIGLRLIRPGSAGVAFALNAFQVQSGSAAVSDVLSVVVAAAIVSDLLSFLLTPDSVAP